MADHRSISGTTYGAESHENQPAASKRDSFKSHLPVFVQLPDGSQVYNRERYSDDEVVQKPKRPGWESFRKNRISLAEALYRTQPEGDGNYPVSRFDQEDQYDLHRTSNTRSAPPDSSRMPINPSLSDAANASSRRALAESSFVSHRRSAEELVQNSPRRKSLNQFYAMPRNARAGRETKLFEQGAPVGVDPSSQTTAESSERRNQRSLYQRSNSTPDSQVQTTLGQPNTNLGESQIPRYTNYLRSNSASNGRADTTASQQRTSYQRSTTSPSTLDRRSRLLTGLTQDGTYGLKQRSQHSTTPPILEDTPSLNVPSSPDITASRQPLTPFSRAEKDRYLYRHLINQTRHHYSSSSESNTSSRPPAPPSERSQYASSPQASPTELSLDLNLQQLNEPVIAKSGTETKNIDKHGSSDAVQKHARGSHQSQTSSSDEHALRVDIEPPTDHEHSKTSSVILQNDAAEVLQEPGVIVPPSIDAYLSFYSSSYNGLFTNLPESAKSNSDIDPEERIAAESSLFDMPDNKSERNSIRVPSDSSDEAPELARPIANSAKPTSAREDLRRIAKEVREENPDQDLTLDGVGLSTSEDEASMKMGPGPVIKSEPDGIETTLISEKPKIIKTEQTKSKTKATTKAIPDVYDKMQHRLRRSLSDITLAKRGIERIENQVATQPLVPPHNQIVVYVPLPRLWNPDSSNWRGFTLTWLGAILLYFSAWYIAENYFCYKYCHRQIVEYYEGVDPTRRAREMWFPYPITMPLKIDEWTGGYGVRFFWWLWEIVNEACDKCLEIDPRIFEIPG